MVSKCAPRMGDETRAEVELEMLGEGVHVLCNDRLGSPEFPEGGKGARTHDGACLRTPGRVSNRSSSKSSRMARSRILRRCRRFRADAPFDQEVARYLQAICVKTPVYGTVSSTLAAVSRGRVEQYCFAEGPPSEARFRTTWCTSPEALDEVRPRRQSPGFQILFERPAALLPRFEGVVPVRQPSKLDRRRERVRPHLFLGAEADPACLVRSG